MPSPARPHPAGTTPTPRPARAPTKEAATTHPTLTDRTAAASSTSESRHPRAGLHARGVHGRRRPPQRHRAPGAARRLAAIVALTAALLVVLFATPAFADSTTAPSLSGVIDNLRNWLVGILAGVATLFLTIGGLRYLTAGGDPGQVEKAKTALKSAAIGYALAILAPLLVSILASIVGG